jgi:hypothetical protein
MTLSDISSYTAVTKDNVDSKTGYGIVKKHLKLNYREQIFYESESLTYLLTYYLSGAQSL